MPSFLTQLLLGKLAFSSLGYEVRKQHILGYLLHAHKPFPHSTTLIPRAQQVLVREQALSLFQRQAPLSAELACSLRLLFSSPSQAAMLVKRLCRIWPR